MRRVLTILTMTLISNTAFGANQLCSLEVSHELLKRAKRSFETYRASGGSGSKPTFSAGAGESSIVPYRDGRLLKVTFSGAVSGFDFSDVRESTYASHVERLEVIVYVDSDADMIRGYSICEIDTIRPIDLKK